MRDALDGEHRETRLLVVIAGVVAIRPFERALGRIDESFEDDLGRSRHLQVGTQAFHQFGLGAAQQTGKLVFGETVRHRRHRRENRRRIGAQRHRHRKRLARMLQAVLAKIERAAAMRQPAHDHLVRTDHLLAIDAQVLAHLVRPAGHRQSPGDQRRCVARPAELDRQRDKSTSLPSQTTSWQGAEERTRGAMLSTCLSTGSLSQASLSPFGGSGSLR
jgi:hypothetical protein